MNLLRSIGYFLACLFVAGFSLTTQAKTDPAWQWMTLSSAHFQIHYHQGEEALAQRAAVLAEDVHDRLASRMKSQPHQRTHIVLVDASDDANGMATPFPYNQIKLYVTQPFGESIFGEMAYDDWLRLLITHEYTHIVQLDMARSLPALLDDIFGNLYFPNLFQPVWLIEGLAVYEETELTGGGRNRSAASDMVLRMAVLENNFPPISHAANYTARWPDGMVPYLWGGRFNAFIASKYGREKLADLSLDYSGRWFPFLVNSTARRVLGRNYDGLWQEWKNELSSRYEEERNKVLAQGLTATRALTRRGDLTMAPAISPDGRQVAYFSSDEDRHPALYLVNIDGSAERKLIDNNASSAYAISWSPDGNGIYYTRIERVRNSNLYNDIYYFDLEHGRETRLTSGLRARDPAPSPDGSRLVFVVNRLGKTRLGTLDLTRKKKPCAEADVTWLGEESDNQYETPRFSPDGQQIVVGVRQADGYKDIRLLDSRGNQLEQLMHDRAVDGGAIWDAGGRSIYFSSDRSGIFNIYRYDLASRQIFQLSNVLGGAFMPAPSPDGRTIAFTNYSSQGFDIHLLDNPPAAAQQAAPRYRDPYPVPQYQEKPVETSLQPYSPAETLYPHLWLPNFGYSTYSGTLAGLFTLGIDAVERHSYTLSTLYGPSQQRTWYDFNYRYDGFYPTLNLRARDIDIGYSGLLVQQAGFVAQGDYVERSRMLEVSLSLPLLRLDRQHRWNLGFQRSIATGLTVLPPWNGYDGTVPAQGVLASARAGYQFNNAKTYGYSISPEGGRRIELGYEQLDNRIGSDYQMKKYSVDWHEYLDLPAEHQVLLLRGFAGKATGDVIAQRAYQLGGDLPAGMLLGIDDHNVYLRGYPLNRYRGQNVGLASIEYRFPLQNIEFGDDNRPLFFKRLHGALFAEAGNAWDNAFDRKDVKRSVGGELRMDMTLGYFLPATLRLGLFRALDDQQNKTLSISLLADLFDNAGARVKAGE